MANRSLRGGRILEGEFELWHYQQSCQFSDFCRKFSGFPVLFRKLRYFRVFFKVPVFSNKVPAFSTLKVKVDLTNLKCLKFSAEYFFKSFMFYWKKFPIFRVFLIKKFPGFPVLFLGFWVGSSDYQPIANNLYRFLFLAVRNNEPKKSSKLSNRSIWPARKTSSLALACSCSMASIPILTTWCAPASFTRSHIKSAAYFDWNRTSKRRWAWLAQKISFTRLWWFLVEEMKALSRILLGLSLWTFLLIHENAFFILFL
jgi:hypothetical protein